LTTRIECSRNQKTTEMVCRLRRQSNRVVSLSPEPSLASAPAPLRALRLSPTLH
jgi:hypothetical protein